MNDGFIAEQISALRVGNRSGIVKQYAVGFAGIDVQRACLVRVPQHLHDAREVVVRQVAAKTGVGLVQHLRGLKPFRFADENLLDVGSNNRGLPVAVDVIVAASLKCFHQRALAPIAKRDNRQIGVF